MEREKEIKKKVEEKEEVKIEKQIEVTNNVALQAIQKEINLEELIRKEEAEREAREEKEILITIEEEKKKSECLVKAIKERELENQYNLRTKEATDQMEKIKQEASIQISVRRSQLKKQIEALRKNADRKKIKLKQQLATVRYTMANEMTKAYKKGDKLKCVNAISSAEQRKIYCSVAFSEDYSLYTECLEGSEFCTTCCDSEFGEFYVNDRQDCYKATCSIVLDASKIKNNETLATGRWIWHESINSLN